MWEELLWFKLSKSLWLCNIASTVPLVSVMIVICQTGVNIELSFMVTVRYVGVIKLVVLTVVHLFVFALVTR